MNVYDVCLETSAEGLCMAHVPNLPGCFARGRGREEVLARLPRTIAEYHDWLADHGESAAVCSNGFSRVFPGRRVSPGRGPKAAEAATTNGGEEIEIRVVEETGAVGPFHAGDAAALFAADHEPVGPGEMEDYFRWMGYARADLLALVRHLPPDLLDWQPFPEWFSIGQVLRHVGNAEEWYVSRLVPPERLPPEWDDDEALPLFDFLEMERRTALARLRGLTAEERGGVFYPTAWTRHPDEAWTLRKVLRRFLEHEREHTAQVREILDLGLRGVMARGAAQDTRLLEFLLGLDERTLAREPVTNPGGRCGPTLSGPGSRCTTS